ncbi:MAG: helix-turn-helix domain-containing protein [Candidatus Limnocylindria bacterium]
MTSKRFLSPGEVATELGISSTTVMKLIHDGRLPAVRVSERIYRIPEPAFERFVAGDGKPDLDVAWRRVRRLPPFGESVTAKRQRNRPGAAERRDRSRRRSPLPR